MILGFLTKYRDYRVRVHTGPGGDTSTSYIMISFLHKPARDAVFDQFFYLCAHVANKFCEDSVMTWQEKHSFMINILPENFNLDTPKPVLKLFVHFFIYGIVF